VPKRGYPDFWGAPQAPVFATKDEVTRTLEANTSADLLKIEEAGRLLLLYLEVSHPEGSVLLEVDGEPLYSLSPARLWSYGVVPMLGSAELHHIDPEGQSILTYSGPLYWLNSLTVKAFAPYEHACQFTLILWWEVFPRAV